MGGTTLWWLTLVAVFAMCLGQYDAISPTLCDDESCRCDAFTRVTCNCTRNYDEITLRSEGAFRLPPRTQGIKIEGCARVYIFPEAINSLLNLEYVHLSHNKYIHFSERSLTWKPRESGRYGGLTVNIHNSSIHEISSHTFQGRYSGIQITNSEIRIIRPFAFSDLTHMNYITMENNVFNNIEIQAFKKFTVDYFKFCYCDVNALPSRFLSGIEVPRRFLMRELTIKHIHSQALLVNAPFDILIERNIIGTVDGDAFRITSRKGVNFNDNIIGTLRKGAFLGFNVRSEDLLQGEKPLSIYNLTVTNADASSFLYNKSNFYPQFHLININESCNCDLTETWEQLIVDTKNPASSVNCWFTDEYRFITLESYDQVKCGSVKENFWIYIVIGVVLIVVIGLIVAFIGIWRERRKKKKVQIIMPDGKTYKETELFMVVERADVLTTEL